MRTAHVLPGPDDDGPLDGLDALDQERAADMVANRPRYAPAITSTPDAHGTQCAAEPQETPTDVTHGDQL